jgi:hypothetical protein
MVPVAQSATVAREAMTVAVRFHPPESNATPIRDPARLEPT